MKRPHYHPIFPMLLIAIPWVVIIALLHVSGCMARSH